AGVEVRLSAGATLAADRVVVAMGSWTGGLLGLGAAVRPVKGQLLVFPAGSPGPARVLYADHTYLLAKADGTVILGGTMEERGFDLEIDGAAEALRDALPRLFPALAGVPARALVGLRPASPDGLPIVGPVRALPAAYVFTAHFRNGFLLAPLTARLAAAEVMGGEAADLLRPLRPQRLVEVS
ncbi:MAG: glycine oxidase, partial [Chloroflexota bacterium]|nr:glycine oxidase [Chloroflexota bacterium]